MTDLSGRSHKPNRNQPWADQPYQLLPTPSNLPENRDTTHRCIWAASEMTHSHNCLLRGLNAILQQAPHIPSSTQQNYIAQDVRDLAFYVFAWTNTVEHHHHTEETTMFPLINKLASECRGTADPVMDEAEDQHKVFHDGLLALQTYAKGLETHPESYKWEEMRRIIDGFAPALVKHMTDEIVLLLGFSDLDSEGLKRCFDEAGKVAKANGNMALLYDMFPLVLGTCDRTYENGNEFPPLPAVVPYTIWLWFGRRHAGAWRFNPCDNWGKPIPLPMLPENRNSTS